MSGKYRIKTRFTGASPAAFIAKVPNEQVRKDSRELIRLFRKVTGKAPKMWGPTIVGFGSYHYVYESGHEGDAPIAGFSPRRPELVIYLSPDMDDKHLKAKLGKHRSGKSCLYIRKLDDIDRDVLEQLVVKSIAEVRKRHPS